MPPKSICAEGIGAAAAGVTPAAHHENPTTIADTAVLSHPGVKRTGAE